MTTRDEDFYFNDLVIFSVEDALFKVPRTAFEKGSESFFGTLFSLPVPRLEAPDGQSDAQPLRLEGIKANEFKILLRALYPSFGDLSHLLSSPASDFAFTKNEYIIILKLSTMWDFQKLRKAAIARLERLFTTDNELFTNGVTYHVASWKVRGFGMLVSRAAYLSQEEMQSMISAGDNLFWNYSVVRDCCRNHRTQRLYPLGKVKCSAVASAAKSASETPPTTSFSFPSTLPSTFAIHRPQPNETLVATFDLGTTRPPPTESIGCNRILLANFPTKYTIKHTTTCDSARKALGLVLSEVILEEIDRSRSR